LSLRRDQLHNRYHQIIESLLGYNFAPVLSIPEKIATLQKYVHSIILIRRFLTNDPDIGCIIGIIELLNYYSMTTLDRVHGNFGNFITVNRL
jgi:hypothetical protein